MLNLTVKAHLYIQYRYINEAIYINWAFKLVQDWNTNYNNMYTQIGATFILLQNAMVGLHCIGPLMID